MNKGKEERSNNKGSNPLVLHTSHIDDRAIAYLCIDINHRLLTNHTFINVLSAMKKLSSELSVDVTHEVGMRECIVFAGE